MVCKFEILVWYDGPQLISLDDGRNKYLAMAGGDEKMWLYLVAPCSQETIDLVQEPPYDYYGLYSNRKSIWIMNLVGNEQQLEVKTCWSVSWNEIPEEFKPGRP